MRILFRSLLAGFLMLALPPGADRAGADTLRPVRIGVVFDGPWDRNEEVLGLFRQEALKLLGSEFDVRFPEGMMLTADFTLAGTGAALDRLLANPDVDAIYAMGVMASTNVGRRGTLSRPVIAPFVLDSRSMGIPKKGGASGVPNLCYVESPSTFERELRVFLDIVPFRKLAFLANPAMLREISELGGELSGIAAELGFSISLVNVAGSAEDALESLPADADAVYMVPLLELAPGDFDSLIRGLDARGLPTFSWLGKPDVERGVLAGLNAGDWFNRLARRSALNLQRILLGENAATIPVALPRREELVVNMATARAIGFSPSFSVLTEATLVDERRRETARTTSLFDAVIEALRVNRDLAAAGQGVEAGSREVGIARAGLLPRVDIGAAGTIVDEDRAAAGFGSVAERSLAARATLRQVLWSEDIRANLSIQKNLQTAREKDRDRLRLDVVQDAATGYLSVLRTLTFEQIQKDNLRLTRSNLELAEIRRTIGLSGPSEVYRWRSQIASDRRSVILANANRNLAEIALNRILHRPLEESFTTEEVDLNDRRISAADPRFRRFIGDPQSFKVFRRFLVEDGLRSSPELEALDAAIAARERALSSARRSFFSPTVSLQGEVSRRISESGAGTGSTVPPPLSDFIRPADDTDWNVGIVASIPLTTGGSRIAEVGRADRELRQLVIEREAATERIEQRIRSAAHLTGASFAALALTRESADAAERNLELVTDAYTRGVVQIIDLLDAQNAALRADLAAADAVYDFLIDLMEVERSVGKYSFFASSELRETWFRNLEQYYESRQEVR